MSISRLFQTSINFLERAEGASSGRSFGYARGSYAAPHRWPFPRYTGPAIADERSKKRDFFGILSEIGFFDLLSNVAADIDRQRCGATHAPLAFPNGGPALASSLSWEKI